MASGWARDDAVQEQIDSTVEDAVNRARRAMHNSGVSAEYCEHCGEAIPEARRLALPGVQYCVQCQQQRDKQQSAALYNRRGSKDSQLR